VPGGSQKLFGLIAMEWPHRRFIWHLLWVHDGLAWAPSTWPVRRNRSRSGCPHGAVGKDWMLRTDRAHGRIGSGGGLTTTRERDGDGWI